MAALLSETTKDVIRVFIWTGSVSHLVDPRIVLPGETPDRQSSVCGQKPFWPGQWFGNGDDFSAKANSLPLCGRCALVAASKEVSGESA